MSRRAARPESDLDSELGEIEFPDPPERIPEWAIEQADEWRRLSRFDLEVKAEELGRFDVVEIRDADLPDSVWGLHIARDGRVRLCVNSRLPWLWKKFATFHELYHLLSHTEGEGFWRNTFQPLTKFESEADLFAWAAIWPEWQDGGA